jgi:hypothetical protein
MPSLVPIKNIRCKNLLFTFAKILFVSSKCPVPWSSSEVRTPGETRSRYSVLLKYAFLIIMYFLTFLIIHAENTLHILGDENIHIDSGSTFVLYNIPYIFTSGAVTLISSSL